MNSYGWNTGNAEERADQEMAAQGWVRYRNPAELPEGAATHRVTRKQDYTYTAGDNEQIGQRDVSFDYYRPAPAPAPAAAPAPAPAPAAPAPPPAALQLEATLASSQAAMDAARAAYAKQNEELTGTVRGLQDLLLKTRSESDAAIKSQELAFQTSAKDQELAFQTYTKNQELAFQTAMQKQELTLNNYMTGIPVAERSAVAPKLGDTRTGGRNAAANTLSQLRIIAPSLLGITDQSGSLGRL
jgi:hypothetical protein